MIEDLVLDEEAGVYRDAVTGRLYIRVTTAIRERGLMEDIEWVTEAGLLRGDYLHQLAHLDDLKRLDESSIDPVLKGKLGGYRKAKRELGIEILESEFRLRSDLYGIAGRADKKARMQGALWLLDLKGGPEKKWHCVQTAMYALMIKEPVKRGALYLRDNDYRLIPHTNRQDFDRAKAVIELTGMMKEAA